MKMSQAVGIVIAGTLLFQVADIAKSAYLHHKDVAIDLPDRQHKTVAEIDRSNREQAKDYAFLYNNPSLEEPMYQKLSKTAIKPSVSK